MKNKVMFKINYVLYNNKLLRGFKKLTLQIIRGYQYFISPNFGRNCRFYPSCSEYSFEAIDKYGLIKGVWLAIKRISKCHPWFPGGIDLP